MNRREDNKGYRWTNLKKIEIIAMSHGFSVVGGGGGGGGEGGGGERTNDKICQYKY